MHVVRSLSDIRRPGQRVHSPEEWGRSLLIPTPERAFAARGRPRQQSRERLRTGQKPSWHRPATLHPQAAIRVASNQVRDRQELLRKYFPRWWTNGKTNRKHVSNLFQRGKYPHGASWRVLLKYLTAPLMTERTALTLPQRWTPTPPTSSQYNPLVNSPKYFWPVDAGIRRHGTT